MNGINIGKQIKTLRTKKGITQADFADFLRVTPQAVSKWENEQSYPDITFLPIIAKYFEISLDALFSIA